MSMYKFLATIEQDQNGAPVILQNTNTFPGNVTAERVDVGVINVTLPMSFDLGKVTAILKTLDPETHVHAWHSEYGPTVTIRVVKYSGLEYSDSGLVYGQLLIEANP